MRLNIHAFKTALSPTGRGFAESIGLFGRRLFWLLALQIFFVLSLIPLYLLASAIRFWGVFSIGYTFSVIGALVAIGLILISIKLNEKKVVFKSILRETGTLILVLTLLSLPLHYFLNRDIDEKMAIFTEGVKTDVFKEIYGRDLLPAQVREELFDIFNEKVGLFDVNDEMTFFDYDSTRLSVEETLGWEVRNFSNQAQLYESNFAVARNGYTANYELGVYGEHHNLLFLVTQDDIREKQFDSSSRISITKLSDGKIRLEIPIRANESIYVNIRYRRIFLKNDSYFLYTAKPTVGMTVECTLRTKEELDISLEGRVRENNPGRFKVTDYKDAGKIKGVIPGGLVPFEGISIEWRKKDMNQ